jgi:hypothetical protein
MSSKVRGVSARWQPPVTLKAGERLVHPAGVVHSAKNVGSGNGAELATYIVEKGKPLVCWPSERPPGAAHGIDVDDQGNGTVTEQRLYQLIRQPKPIADRQFEIEFLDSGVEAFAFTFG